VPDDLSGDRFLLLQLLGRLSGDERAAVEERFFGDDEFFERLIAMEEELIRDYIRDELSPEHRQEFERILLGSPELRNRIEETRDLMAVLAGDPVGQKSPPERARWTFFSGLFQWRVALPLLGFLLIGLDDLRLRRLDNRQAEEPVRTAETVPVSFVLLPGLTKGAGSGSQRFTIPKDAAKVRLLMETPTALNGQTFRAEISSADGGAKVWAGVLGALQYQNGRKFVPVDLAVSSLAPGDYVLRLAASSSQGEFADLDTYVFGVMSP
jgi:hypothetical protein